MKRYSSSRQDAGCNPLVCQMSTESTEDEAYVIIKVHIFRIFWCELSYRLGSARSTRRSVCRGVRANSPHIPRLTCRTNWIYGNSPCKLYTFVGSSIYYQVITSRASSWKITCCESRQNVMNCYDSNVIAGLVCTTSTTLPRIFIT